MSRTDESVGPLLLPAGETQRRRVTASCWPRDTYWHQTTSIGSFGGSCLDPGGLQRIYVDLTGLIFMAIH